MRNTSFNLVLTSSFSLIFNPFKRLLCSSLRQANRLRILFELISALAPGQIQPATIRQLASNNFNRLLSKNHISVSTMRFLPPKKSFVKISAICTSVAWCFETAQLPVAIADVDNDTSSPHASFSDDAMTVHAPTQLLIDYLTKLGTAPENPVGTL